MKKIILAIIAAFLVITPAIAEPLPDLTVTDVRMVHDTPETCHVEADVGNIGNTASIATDTRFLIVSGDPMGNPTILPCEMPLPALSPYTEVTIICTEYVFWFNINYAAAARADSQDIVYESDEGNNHMYVDGLKCNPE